MDEAVSSVIPQENCTPIVTLSAAVVKREARPDRKLSEDLPDRPEGEILRGDFSFRAAYAIMVGIDSHL